MINKAELNFHLSVASYLNKSCLCIGLLLLSLSYVRNSPRLMGRLAMPLRLRRNLNEMNRKMVCLAFIAGMGSAFSSSVLSLMLRDNKRPIDSGMVLLMGIFYSTVCLSGAIKLRQDVVGFDRAPRNR